MKEGETQHPKGFNPYLNNEGTTVGIILMLTKYLYSNCWLRFLFSVS